MDPFSIASGVAGIVGFAAQLAKTASKVKKAVEELKSAPKETKELIERLALLETACELIGFHLERRETLPNPSSPPSLNIISKALAQFLAKAQDLEQMLSTVSISAGLNQTSRSKFGAVSRVRLVFHRDKIISLVQEIDRVVSLLQFVVQVDMWISTSIPAQPPPLSSNGIVLMDESPKLETSSGTLLKDFAPSQYVLDPKVRRAKYQQCRTFRYLGCITWTITDGWIGDNDDDDANRIAYRKEHITFRLPFTSTQYSIQYNGGMGTPSYALNVVHVIDYRTELGRRLDRVMRPRGDLEELYELISSQQLSIYSVYRWDGEDFNLFFMAVANKWVEGFKYLLQHDFRQKFEEDETPQALFYSRPERSDKACEITETLLSMRSHEMREKDIKYLLHIGCEAEYFGRYLNVFLNSLAIDHSKVLSWALKAFMRNVSYDVHIDSSWIPALRTLIEHGVNLHQPCDSRGLSVYVRLLSEQDYPFEAESKVYSWLELLKACGAEISNYLETETTLIDKFGFGQGKNARKKKKVTLDFDGLPMPSWRWELPTECSIIEVMEEFPNFGLDHMGSGLDHLGILDFFFDPEGPYDIKSWKAENFDLGWAQYPFVLSPLDIPRMHNGLLDSGWGWETYNRAVEVRGKRFARRQAKKWGKAYPREKPLSNKMPGTWVE